jgi:hypothetical protein
VAQLLTNACSNLAKLTSDSMQLFAADMSEVLKTYRCDTSTCIARPSCCLLPAYT